MIERLKRGVKGYTLIELLIYLSLFVVLSSATAVLFSQAVQLHAISRARSQLSWQGEGIFLELSQQIKAASSVDSPGPGTEAAFLVLDGGQLRYEVVDGILQKVDGGVVTGVTTDPLVVEGLSFANYSSVDNPGVQIKFTLRLPAPLPNLPSISEDFQTSVFLRH